jgi:dipeptidyl aminopeptidase/acylaminoacyl peptidase
MSRTPRSFGLWDSPLSPRALAARVRLGEVLWDDAGDTLVWVESRSDQTFLMAQTGGDAPRELTTGVRGRVGYGGGDFTVGGGLAVYVDARTGRLMRLALRCGDASALPEPLTPSFGSAASPRLSGDGRWVAYVHHDDRNIDRLAVVDAAGRYWPQILASGADFYAYPRFSPDGRWAAWIQWNHPQMPWDGTTLMLAPLRAPADGGLPVLGEARVVAGGAETAIFQPEFTPDGERLVYVSDESGFGHLYEHELATGESRQITQGDAEHGAPAWIQEMRTYALAGSDALYASVNRRGFMRVERIDRRSGAAQPLAGLLDYTDVMQLTATPDGRRLAAVASSSVTSPRVIALEVAGERPARVVARSSGETLAPAALAKAEALTWQTQGGAPCHGLYYAPASERFVAAGRPPLIVLVHGGPTSQADSGFDAQTQFFATRGYAVLAVNHRGSTGYGRPYMLELRKAWGVVDVEDCVSGMRHAVDKGLADGARTVIMGASAGGYTVLQTMVTYPEAFAAGISSYGIANQFTLVADTHKFEERYNDSIMGVLPDDAAIYRERSPLFHAHEIKRPLAIFQGEDDKVVPKDQAESLVKALQRNGVPHVYHLYKGEGHGWRKAETIEHFYGALDAFLRQHLIFC